MKLRANINSRSNSISVIAFVLLAAAVLACNLFDETDKANKLVDEGNTVIADVKKLGDEADETKGKMDAAVAGIKEESDLTAARSIAKDLIAAYDKLKAKCDEAAKKFDEASKLKVKDKFKEYLQLKYKEFQKRAEMVDAAKGTPQALIDSKNKEDYNTAMTANNEKVAKLRKEAEDIATQATKIQTDNPEIFKK